MLGALIDKTNTGPMSLFSPACSFDVVISFLILFTFSQQKCFPLCILSIVSVAHFPNETLKTKRDLKLFKPTSAHRFKPQPKQDTI
jgi:hypothetical protein